MPKRIPSSIQRRPVGFPKRSGDHGFRAEDPSVFIGASQRGLPRETRLGMFEEDRRSKRAADFRGEERKRQMLHATVPRVVRASPLR